MPRRTISHTQKNRQDAVQHVQTQVSYIFFYLQMLSVIGPNQTLLYILKRLCRPVYMNKTVFILYFVYLILLIS